MTRKTQIETARADLVKTVRTAIRLKHSLAADHEIQDVLPERLKAFEKMVMRGLLPAAVDIKKLTDHLGD